MDEENFPVFAKEPYEYQSNFYAKSDLRVKLPVKEGFSLILPEKLSFRRPVSEQSCSNVNSR